MIFSQIFTDFRSFSGRGPAKVDLAERRFRHPCFGSVRLSRSSHQPVHVERRSDAPAAYKNGTADIYACLPGAGDVGETSQGSVPVLFGIRVAWSNFGRMVSAAPEPASFSLRSAALTCEASCGRGLRQSGY